ncbi:hypothetical protein [Actibacterium sp. 188UL27-1]|uniref:DUF6958 family protein n=1 Tax=Actibacterium sp. 188UL27-1 TaxID=2786961 RepID=UPI00195A4167|nr:hypothetical protein [Actibacterium sp. 188UL27-1]MBM7067028.1 hypothetical protein [Actibacterium sp. 188UL27-1]
MTDSYPHEPRTECRTPAEGRDGVTRIPTWKYTTIRTIILDLLDEAGADGLAFKDLSAQVKSHLSSNDRAHLGSVGWHVTCVKLNMEVDGDIMRLPGKGPQRIIRT